MTRAPSFPGRVGRLARAVSLIMLVGGICAFTPVAAGAQVTPALGCPTKATFHVQHNGDGFVDQGAPYTVTGPVYPGTRVTVVFANNATGAELFRHVTPMSDGTGALTDTANLASITPGLTVLPSVQYVCSTTGQVKNFDAATFRMEPVITPPCDPPPCSPCKPLSCGPPLQ